MHPLLQRQLRRHLGDDASLTLALRPLLDAVDAAYRDSDVDRLLLERAMELSSKELLQANSDMHAVFQALPDLFFRLDATGTILDCRGGRGQDLLVPVEQLIGRRIDRVPVREVAEKFREATACLRAGGSNVVIEYNLTAAGEIRHYEARLMPVLNGQIVVVIRETTERFRAADELRRHDAFLRQIIDLNPSFIFAKDADGRFSLVNQAVADAYGSSVDNLIGKTDADFNPNQDEVRSFLELDREVIRTGRDRVIPEERLTDARGRTLWLQTIKRAIMAPDGRTRQVLGVSADITQRRLAEKNLEERTAQLLEHQAALHDMALLDTSDQTASLRSIIDIASATLRAVHGSVWILSDDRRGLQCRCRHQAGQPEIEARGYLGADACPRYFEAISTSRTIAANDWRTDPRTGELPGTHPQPLGVSSVLHTSIRQQGTMLGTLCFEHVGPPHSWTPEEQNFAASTADLIALSLAAFNRQQLEMQLRQSQKMEAVGTLAGGIAHDFNNILTAILGYCDLLRLRLDPGSPEHAHAEEIWRASDRAATLTRQLLTFSRKQHVAPRVLNLGQIITGMESMLRRIIGENIEFITYLDPDVGAVTVDPSQIEQVLLNLVVNAREAMPSGGRVTVSLGRATTPRAGDPELPGGLAAGGVELTVSDSGCGMDEETRSRIFEPFFTTKGPGKGTGLGLAMVYAIVHQSGGTILVDSSPGRGTRISIVLPQSEAAPEPVEEESTRLAVARGQETILLAEDEESLRTLSTIVLTGHGYVVLTAPDGESALALAESHPGPIDILITDMVMPGMSGARLAELLLDRRPNLPVLYLSGYTADNVVPLVGERTGRAFLQKPFAIDLLATTVRRLLDERSERGDRTARSA